MSDWRIPLDKLNLYLTTLKPCHHKKTGRSIIMPSGSGKSYWMKNLQHTSYKNWKAIPKHSFIDSDPLMIAVGAMPPLEGEDFSGGLTWDKDMETIAKRCDTVMIECKKRGLWIMGATWWEPKLVDAFVVLPAELNKKYLKGKSDIGEGFNKDYYKNDVLPYIEGTIKPLAEEYNIPIFDSIESCAMFIIQSESGSSAVSYTHLTLPTICSV